MLAVLKTHFTLDSLQTQQQWETDFRNLHYVSTFSYQYSELKCYLLVDLGISSV